MSEALDIVIDDASHLLQPTTATFEMLFPQLRPDGLYVIEDWSFRHLNERAMNLAMKAEPGVNATKVAISASNSNAEFEIPMSWTTEVRATDGFCEIRGGDAEIPAGISIADYIGYVGNQMFEACNGSPE